MEIRKLQKLTDNHSLDWGHNGYSTDTIYSLSSIEFSGSFEFLLKENIYRTPKLGKLLQKILLI